MGKKRKGQDNTAENNIVIKKRKDKKIKDEIARDDVENVNEDSKNGVQPTSNFTAVSNSGQPKKIIFVDDEPHEVPETPSKTKKSKASKKIPDHNSETLREEDVKDEDIDRFCDELNEEDNKQYENWVQLIEASLSSNKKKPK